MRYSDAELEQMLSDIESDRVERKESWKGDAPEKARQAVCAFANDLSNHREPGVLFVGAKDDGSPSGLAITDELLRTLADIKTDGKILPPPTVTVEKRVLQSAEIAVVTVQPADATPVRYDGRSWIRLGARRGVATRQDETILNEKRRYRGLPFDVQPMPSTTLDVLSKSLFEQEYLPRAIGPDLLAANDRSYAERLSGCKMITAVDSPIPTVLGVIVIGTSPRDWIPGSYVQFLRIQGTELSDPIVDESVIDGPLGQVLRRVDEKLDAHNRVSVDLTSGSIEARVFAYPRAALQQLTRNALMHRAYEGTHSPVRVLWFDDRVEIHNPGGPYGSVTLDNFGQPGLTDYRNPHLAEAMKVLGFVQRFGVGISVSRSELQRNGNPPLELRAYATNVVAIARKHL